MVRELLSNADYNIFDNYLRLYGGSNDGIEANIDAWASAKDEWLGKMFGNELIKSRQVSYSVSKDEKNQEFRNLNNNKFWKMFKFLQNSIERAGYILAVATTPWYSDEDIWRPADIAYLCNIEALVHNATQEKFALCPKETYNSSKCACEPFDKAPKVVIPRGTKIIRCLNKHILPIIKDIVTEEDYKWINKKIEEYGTALSIQYQSSEIQGELCISIHPMDYVTMSDNSYNWTSCMSWENNGEYHAGTLEMLTSPCIVVAYLKGSQTYSDWNSKRWRELFVVSKEIIVGIKGYPYNNEGLEDITMNWLRDLVKENLGWVYDNETPIKSSPNQASINGDFTFTWDIEFKKMYNDCYSKHPVFVETGISGENITVYASGPCLDIIDGSELDEEIPESYVYHPSYDGLVRCAGCGYWCHEDEVDSDGFCYEECHVEEDDEDED